MFTLLPALSYKTGQLIIKFSTTTIILLRHLRPFLKMKNKINHHMLFNKVLRFMVLSESHVIVRHLSGNRLIKIFI